MDKYFWVPTNSAVLSAFFMPAAIFIGVPTAETFFLYSHWLVFLFLQDQKKKRFLQTTLFQPFYLLSFCHGLLSTLSFIMRLHL